MNFNYGFYSYCNLLAVAPRCVLNSHITHFYFSIDFIEITPNQTQAYSYWKALIKFN